MNGNDHMVDPYSGANVYEFLNYEKISVPQPSTKFFETKEVLKMQFYLGIGHAEINRSTYTLLDFIGDVGALLGALQLIVAFVLSNFFQVGILLEDSLLAGTFRKRDSKDKLKVNEFKLTIKQWFWEQLKVYVCRCWCFKKGTSSYIR